MDSAEAGRVYRPPFCEARKNSVLFSSKPFRALRSKGILTSGRPHNALLFVITEDWYFCSHRLGLAEAAQRAGYRVTVATRVRSHGHVIRAAGLKLIPYENVRSGLNPFKELAALLRLIAIYRRERPDISHHVAMKPVIYGSIAARFAGTQHVVNAIAGMGWVFSNGGISGLLRPFVRAALRLALRSGTVIVQNPDDVNQVIRMGVPRDRIRHVAGSGVNLWEFQHRQHHAERSAVPLVVLPARLLWDKGVGEFVAAARILRKQGIAARFMLAGQPDPLNPSSIPLSQVDAWVREGVIEHAGWVEDMAALFSLTDVVCLPSYREGLPKSLIEAAAAALPIVTTDAPGCRDVVRNGDNGFLVPVKDAKELALALNRLLSDAELRLQMGARGRVRAENEFGLDRIIDQTLRIYAETDR